MGQFFSMLPKGLLAFLVIAGGIGFLILWDPPHTICESQIEVFRTTQKRFLFKDEQKKKTQPAKYRLLVDHCKTTNNPGGCYELFQESKMMLKDLHSVPSDCAGRVGAIDEVNKALWEVNDLILRLAWGEKPPGTYHEKFGWLDTSDISLFCELKQQIIDSYGVSAWESFREKTFRDLPGAKDMSRNDVWDMSIISENCAKYP
jgi:hypothetical protein